MASSTYGIYAVKGVSQPFVTYRTDFRVGRIDFQLRNYGDNPVQIKIQESEVNGTASSVVVNDTLINVGGGVVDLPINVAKGQVQLLSGSGNTAASSVHVMATFFGLSFYGGNLADMEDLNRSGWTAGTDLPTGVRD
jgi:hypothetical protein